MERTIKTAFLVLPVFFLILAGCEEVNTKQDRLALYTENVELQKQTEQCDDEVIKLKEKISQLEGQVANLTEQRKVLEQQLGEKKGKELEAVFGTVMEENKELRVENAALRSAIEKLKKQLEESQTAAEAAD